MIRFFVPTTDDCRGEILDEAIMLAKNNLGKTTEIWPIDTRTQFLLMCSADADEMIAALRSGGYTDDGDVNVFFVRKDIHTENTNFCFGATVLNNIVISDFRVTHSVTGRATKVAMLAYLIEHEIGHAYGVADDFRSTGIYDMHCKDPLCVMQQVTSVGQLADFAKRNITGRPEDAAECYCSHCRKRFEAKA